MKTESTQDLLDTLSEILTLAPNFRLGQLIGLLANRVELPYDENVIVEIEDDELLPAAKEFLEVVQKRHEEYAVVNS